MERKAFSVILQSNKCCDTFPNNTNFQFSNTLPREIDVRGYEVGLVKAYISDTYKRPNLEPVVVEAAKEKNFYNEFTHDNEVIIQDATKSSLPVFKTFIKFNHFINKLNTLFEQLNMHCILVPAYSSDEKAVSMKMMFSPPKGFQLHISHPLNNILGYNRQIFREGNYLNDRDMDESLYESIETNKLIGKIDLYKYYQQQIFLDQIKGQPELEVLINEMAATLIEKNHDVSFVVDNDSSSLSYDIKPATKRIILSKFLNTYLGQDDTFYFQGQATIRVPKDIFHPHIIDEYIFDDPKTRSSSKILICADCVRPDYFADKEMPVLALFDRKNQQNTESTYKQSPILYKEVQHNFISQITISVLTDKFTFIAHSKYPSVVELRFRLSDSL